jgi:hypothetical protein
MEIALKAFAFRELSTRRAKALAEPVVRRFPSHRARPGETPVAAGKSADGTGGESSIL